MTPTPIKSEGTVVNVFTRCTGNTLYRDRRSILYDVNRSRCSLGLGMRDRLRVSPLRG